MTTSGSTVFGMTRNELIAAAIRKTGRLASGQVPTAQQYTDGAQALNSLLAYFQTIGMPLWSRTSTQFALTLNTATYTIGSGLTINVTAPLKLYQAFAVNTDTDTGTEMNVVSLFDNTINILETSGSLPTQISYQPKIDAGLITIWPTPDSTAVSDIQVKIIYQRPFEMFTASGETLDIPKEWHQPIIYHLAVALSPEWGVPLNDRSQLKKEAEEYLQRVLEFGQEDGSIFFQARTMS